MFSEFDESLLFFKTELQRVYLFDKMTAQFQMI